MTENYRTENLISLMTELILVSHLLLLSHALTVKVDLKHLNFM